MAGGNGVVAMTTGCERLRGRKREDAEGKPDPVAELAEEIDVPFLGLPYDVCILYPCHTNNRRR